MALISCPECGKQISDQAPACIHCGYPLPKQPTAPAAPPSPDRFSVVLTACPDGPETQSKVVELLMAELGISRAEPRPTWTTARWFPLSSCGRG